MGRYLTDLATVSRRTGFPVVEVDGWQTRARSGSGGDSTAGYESGKPNHVIVHHTASNPSSDGWPDVNYCCYQNQDAPVGNLYLSRDGTVYVMAGGAANTNGSGHDPCGLVPDDAMNAASVAIEAANNGTGETWPDRQLDCYRKLCAELCAAYDIPTGRIHSHFEWAPGRKIDPAGQSDYAAGSAMWDMDAFRSDVAAGSGGTPAPQPPKPDPAPTPPKPQEDWMADLPTIKKGQSGPYVERMQHLLAAAGYMDPANVKNYDGVWGNGTDSAKAKFDNAHGLTPSPPTDCGAKSWESLMTGKKW